MFAFKIVWNTNNNKYNNYYAIATMRLMFIIVDELYLRLELETFFSASFQPFSKQESLKRCIWLAQLTVNIFDDWIVDLFPYMFLADYTTYLVIHAYVSLIDALGTSRQTEQYIKIPERNMKFALETPISPQVGQFVTDLFVTADSRITSILSIRGCANSDFWVWKHLTEFVH